MHKTYFSLNKQENAFQQLLNAKMENTIITKLKNAYALKSNLMKISMELALDAYYLNISTKFPKDAKAAQMDRSLMLILKNAKLALHKSHIQLE